MKNLKKVLLALVIVAMLVSSVVTIAIANESEPEYTGSFTQANRLYTTAEKSKGLDKQSAALVKFYSYIVKSPIDPTTKGYAELIVKYNNFTFTVAQGLYARYEADKSTNKFTPLYNHVINAPALDETLTVSGVVYSDFVKTVNFAIVENADSLIDALFANASGDGSYYEYLAAQQALTKFFDEVESLVYDELKANEAVYNGNLTSIQALLKRIKPNASLEELKFNLAEIYTYLRITPVNPATDGFAEFLAGYNAQCKALLEAFEASIDGAETVEEQVQKLKEMRAYLEATPLLESVVDAFNAKLAEVIAEYNSFANNFADGTKLGTELEYIENITLITDITELTNLIDALEAIEETDGSDPPYIEQKINAFKAVYQYLAQNEIDPASAGYAELVAKYNAQLDLIIGLLNSGITEQTNVEKKINGIALYYQFLGDCPVNEAAIEECNALKAEVVKRFNDFSNALKEFILPTYTPAAPSYVSTDVEMLNYMLSKIEITGDPDDLDESKVAMSAMYTYLLAVEIDTEEEGYVEFVNAYKAKRAELTAALLAKIEDAETPEAKLAAFEAVKAYLVATPYWYKAVVDYNNMVGEVYEADAQTAEKLTIGNEYIYFAAAEIIEFFMNDAEEETPIDEIFANIEALYVYSLRSYDITDEHYSEFVQKYNEIFGLMNEYLVGYAEEAIINTDIDKVSAVCEFLKKAPFSQKVVDDFSTLISTKIESFSADSETVDEQFPNLTYIYKDLGQYISKFNRAEGLDERIAAFKELYEAIEAVDDTILTSFQSGNDEFRAEYSAICEKMAADIVDSIIVDITVASSVQLASFEKACDFLIEYMLSQTAVDGYNAKLNVVKGIPFADVVASITADCPKLDYESPETTESDFEALIDYVGVASNSDDNIVVAYNYFTGKYSDAKAFDFAKNGFAKIVEDFTAAKKAISDKYVTAVKDAELNAKSEKLALMFNFVKQNCISSNIVDAYNAACKEVGDDYTEAYKATYTPFAEIVAKIHTHLKECPVDTSLLTDEQLAIYDDIQLKLDALECAEAYGLILEFKTTKGNDKYVFITQKKKLQAVSAYIDMYEVTENYTEYALSNVLFAQAAEDYIDLCNRYIAELAGEDEVMKAELIASLKQSIEESMMCKIMADLFNATFAPGDNDEKIVYNGEENVPDEATGTLAEFSELMQAYLECKQTGTILADEKGAKSVALKALLDYLEENPLDAASSFATLIEDISAAETEFTKLTESQKQAADAETPEDEYELNDGRVQYNMEDGKLPAGVTDKKGATHEVATETLSDGTENKYWLVKSGNDGTNYDIDFRIINKSTGTVYEFDLMIPLGETALSFAVRPCDDNDPTVTYFMSNDFKNGKLENLSTFDSAAPEGVELTISQGNWTHVIVVLDPVTDKMTLYFDYVKIGTAELRHGGTGDIFDVTKLRLAFDGSNAAIAIDNFDCYSGTSYRIHGKFSQMSESDKFKYYVDLFSNVRYNSVSRYIAYNKVATMVDAYRGQQDYKDYVDIFDAFDHNSIFSAEEKEKKLAELVELMNESGADDINSQNYTTIGKNVEKVEAYISENSYYLDQSSADYNDVTFRITKAYADISRVEQLLELIETLDKFTNATTVAGMTRRVAEVAAQYEKCNFSEAENYEKASKDPAIVAFLATIGENITLDMYYNEVIPQLIAKRLTYENAGKIVKCVNRLKALVENADGLTEAQFLEKLMETAKAEENVDYVKTYMAVIRNMIMADNYDKTYVGLEEAIRVFNYLDTRHFYQLVVEEHLLVITTQLGRYSITNSYIDKLGVCTYVRNYIAENSVDINDPLIAPCFTKLLVFEEELKTYETEYRSLLNANTFAFIALVERMSAFVEYKDIKPLYDEALNNYYYNMNIDTDAVKAAVATFEAYGEFVKSVEENSMLFVEAAKKLSVATKTNAIYKVLVECAEYVDGVDESIDGVVAALEVYNAKLSAYNAKTNPVNTQIAETSNVVCSVRTMSIDATVLATVKKIINK